MTSFESNVKLLKQKVVEKNYDKESQRYLT